jgi:hypothetical protein
MTSVRCGKKDNFPPRARPLRVATLCSSGRTWVGFLPRTHGTSVIPTSACQSSPHSIPFSSSSLTRSVMALPSKVARNGYCCAKSALSSSSLPRRGISLRTSVEEIGLFCTIERAFLSQLSGVLVTSIGQKTDFTSPIAVFLWHGTRRRDKWNRFFSLDGQRKTPSGTTNRSLLAVGAPGSQMDAGL